MIQKHREGRGFRGLLTYVFRESRELGHGEARVLATNMAARTPRGLAAEFGAFRALNPRVSRPVYHCALRLPDGESLEDDGWASFASEYLEGMGFSDAPYVVVRHAPGHVHLIASRVRADGSRVDLWHSHWRSGALVHRLEDRYGLSHAVDGGRDGHCASPRQHLRSRVDLALGTCDGTKEHFADTLRHLGVAVAWRRSRAGGVLGASFALRDQDTGTFSRRTGSQLGRDYAWSRLSTRLAARAEEVMRQRDPIQAGAPRGVEGYLPSLTDPANDRAGHTARDGGERVVGAVLPPANGKEGAVAPRWEHRDLDVVIAREEAEAIFARARERDLDRGGRFDAAGAAITVWSGGERAERIGAVYVAWHTPSDGQATIRRVEWSASRPRAAFELARAWEELRGDRLPRPAAPDGQEPDGDRDDGPRSARPRPDDRTLRAAFGQLVGMGAERFEVGVHALDRGMILRTWGVGELLASAPWLKAMNAHGHDVYVRPAGSAGLVLVDDLSRSALDRMRLAGLDPAAVVETSPGNHQAWVRLTREPLPPSLATAAARELAGRFDGDPNSADWRHFGRLAGFTNRKPERTRPDGLHPFVRLVEASGREAPLAHRLLDDAMARLAAEQAREREAVPARGLPPAESGADIDVGAEFRRRVDRLLARIPNPDYSRVDWMVCRRLVERHPGLAYDALARALREGSPHLEERKGRHAEDYVRRTAEKALGLRVREHGRAHDDPGR